MPYAQSFELGQFKNKKDYLTLGTGIGHSSNGLHLNPHYGKNVNLRNGEGLSDIISTGVNFFKDHGQMIGDVANISSNIAKTIQTIKNIKNDDEKLFELKRIKQEIQNRENPIPSKITKAQQEILDKIRKSGNGMKPLKTSEPCYGQGIKVI